MNVLLADNDPAHQEVARGLLKALGCGVSVVENGEEAVEAAAGGAFDLLLIACHLPTMDGLDAARAIRKMSTGDGRPPIVALTLDSIEKAKADISAAGMDDVLAMPVSREDLQTLLRRWRPPPSATPPAASEAVPGSAPSSIDPAPIETLRALDPEGERRLLHRAITKFIDYSDGLVAHLAEAVDNGETTEVARIAHSLKSSSANLGATDLARQCAEIEERTQGDSLPHDINGRLEGLNAAYNAARRDLSILADIQ